MPDPSSGQKGGTLRLFVAIELPGEVREALSRLQHELQRRGLEKLRWVRPEGIHLTLKFLGPTPAEKVPTIEEAVSGAITKIPPHELRLGTLGTFHERSAPRVLWIDLDGDRNTLRSLQRRVESALEIAGFPKESRGFSPHLTLARVRPETARLIAKALPAALDGVRMPTGIVPVHTVSLMRSTLRPGGALYEQIAAFSLGRL